jgi:hypothetical protein
VRWGGRAGVDYSYFSQGYVRYDPRAHGCENPCEGQCNTRAYGKEISASVSSV